MKPTKSVMNLLNSHRILPHAFLIGILLLITPIKAPAQRSNSSPPKILQLRYDENNEYYCRDENRDNFYAQVKCIPLRKKTKDQEAPSQTKETFYLSFGGEVRELGEYYDYELWGEEIPHNGYLLQRYMFHADLRLGGRLRLFGQIKSGIESGRKGGGRPTDVDKVDLHQAFADIVLWRKEKDSLSLRAGRQEITFGASRLVSFREGPNVRQSFDGLRATVLKNDWKVDVFAVKPVETNRGYFDDSADNSRTFWGAYAVRPLKIIPSTNIDLYYLGLDRKQGRFQAGAGRERRQTIGTRIWGSNGNWDYDNELIYQFGRFSSNHINAWAFSTATGYTIKSTKFHPRVGLDAGIASGDRNTNDGKLNTFNALFPKGKYFGEAELLGPYNIIAIQPSIKLKLRENLSLVNYYSLFWRESRRDGIYGVPGNLIRPGNANQARYIGSHTDTEFEWEINRTLTFTAAYLHFFSGKFLKQTGPSRDVNFVSAGITYKF